MLFTEDQLYIGSNPFSILDNATYLTEQEVRMSPQMIPVMESSRLQSYIIDFNGIRQLSESTGLNYLDAAVLVAEQDGIDPSQACIAIDEADLIEDPSLYSLGAVVVRPLSESDPEFMLCLETVDAYLDTYDDAVFDSLISTSSFNEGRILRKAKKKIKQNIQAGKAPIPDSWSSPSAAPSLTVPETPTQEPPSKPSKIFHKISGIGHKFKKTVGDVIEKATETPPQEPTKPSSGGSKIGSAISSLTGSSNTGNNTESTSKQEPTTKPENTGWGFGTKAGIGAGIAAVIGGGVLAYNHYRDKPKSVIAKRIAALRNIYSRFMQRAQKAPNDGIKNRLKRVAAKILGVIDKLLGFLQRKADGR